MKAIALLSYASPDRNEYKMQKERHTGIVCQQQSACGKQQNFGGEKIDTR
jgi:hypothetical protein